jgi:hypothetical protein
VRVRRARIVSEPVTEYVRYEHDVTEGLNLASGEDVGWLPRDRAVDLLIPAVDFWVFDGAVVVLNHHDGDGTLIREERRDDAGLARFFLEAFARIWERSTPHKEYVI